MPKTEDENYLNYKERELVFHFIKSLLFLPQELQMIGLDVLEHHIDENMSIFSSKTLVDFKKELLCEFDPKGTPGQFSTSHLLNLLCLADEQSP